MHKEVILEKPENEQEARSFIAGYTDSPPSTVGSVLCVNLNSGEQASDVDTAYVHFKDTPMPEETVTKLLAEGDCMYCAGALMVEHPLVVPHIDRIEGTQDSVMGLSKLKVMQLIMQVADPRVTE